jgi:PAS domain S-box-containing protein
MNWTYAYTPQIWPSVLTISLLIALAVFARRRNRVPGAIPFFIACLFAILWATGSVMEYVMLDLATKIFWVKFQATWQVPVAIAVTCFILEYVSPGRWLTPRNLALLSIPWVVGIGMMLTDDLYHLVWSDFSLSGTVMPHLNPGGWLIVAYALGVLGALNLIVLGWLFLRSPQHRSAVIFLLVGQIGGHALYLLGRLIIFRPDRFFNPLGMVVEFVSYAIALFGFRIFDPIPLARQQAITQMSEGMFVLDNQGRVASLNPAAECILHAASRQIKGKPILELLPAFPAEHLEDPGGTEIEFSLDSNGEIRHYATVISLLKDFRGRVVGRLLLMRDVSEQKRARSQILEQQRALAVLQEREQLARELHDNLGQAFAFVNVQGQTVQRLLDRGDVPTAQEYVGRLVQVAREADVDIRESIMGLRATISERGLFPALAKYLSRYEKNYGIQTRLEGVEAFRDGDFEALVEVQLLRILQEALTNVRKHANAHCVQILFAARNGRAHITVQDDGQGFNPGTASAGSEEHVGLRVIRERAAEIGGSVEIRSAPDAGTQVLVQVPVSSKQ